MSECLSGSFKTVNLFGCFGCLNCETFSCVYHFSKNCFIMSEICFGVILFFQDQRKTFFDIVTVSESETDFAHERCVETLRAKILSMRFICLLFSIIPAKHTNRKHSNIPQRSIRFQSTLCMPQIHLYMCIYAYISL